MKKTVDIALPVYYGNLHEIEPSIKQQLKVYKNKLKNYKWKIIIAINGKNADKVIELSKKLSKKYKQVTYTYTSNQGKGNGVINAWLKSKADVRAYMDIDLATDINLIKNLVDPITNNKCDICVGSRYHKDSKVKRSFKRYIISRVYHSILLKLLLNASYTEAQCGFKAINKKFVKEVIPLVRDRNWFFETEMMYIAQKKGLRIKEIPVRWEESSLSGIKLLKVIPHFLKESIKLRFRKIK